MALGDLVRQRERHVGIIGEGEKPWEAAHLVGGIGKKRGRAAGGELLNRLVFEDRRVEIARALPVRCHGAVRF